MIVVDTSVWVEVFRNGKGPEANHLRLLLDHDEVCLAIVVRLEILSGAGRRDRARLSRLLAALPVFYPTEDTWATIGSWIERAAGAGHRFGIADLLIAAIAAENGAVIWSLDSGFVRLSRLGVVSLHVP